VTIVNLALIAAALACAFGLLWRLADQQDDNRQGGQGTGGAEDANGESSGEQRGAEHQPRRGLSAAGRRSSRACLPHPLTGPGEPVSCTQRAAAERAGRSERD